MNDPMPKKCKVSCLGIYEQIILEMLCYSMFDNQPMCYKRFNQNFILIVLNLNPKPLGYKSSIIVNIKW